MPTNFLRKTLLLAGCAAAISFSAACGDGADGDVAPTQPVATVGGFQTTIAVATVPRSTRGTAGGPEPVLPQPAAQYQPLLTDLVSNAFAVNPPNVYLVDKSRFALLGQFSSGKVAPAAIDAWGFLEGWSTQYDPTGQLASLLQGGYYLTMESYLFKTPEGAASAYDTFTTQYSSLPGSVTESPAALGNESAGYSVLGQKVGASDLDAEYHRFIFRRGNMIGIVQTNGAAPFMTIDIARNYAVFMDEQALGQRPAVLPTPIPTPGPTFR